MIINYEIEKLTNTLYDFYNATGITIDLLKSDFTQVCHPTYEYTNYCKCIRNTATGKKACKKSDMILLEKCKQSKKAEMHICHAGLVDVAVPILYDDEIIGYLIFGQMKTDTDFSKLKNYIEKLGINANDMEGHYNLISLYDSDKIQSLSNITTMLIKYILLEKMLKPDINESMQKAVNYINDNLSEKLSIKSISQNINVSKSALYNKFHEYFNCTISEYINALRVEKSKELLSETEYSIEDISQKCGFASASYFSKTFKRLTGMSPLKYKKGAK